ncbi:T9SS type A sorting domain-containing protein [Candidatus Poribacteria bacterium]|nr:T9SS type A sorting domain-containing protein [Candidatus Poribacteria bacterium]MYA55583.1 T9SS type A sorting domain-containing protein [Candidatus Poribacteria bacterium]
MVMTDIQQFVANEMERHGFGRKTFRLETDELDRVVVHRVTGKFLSSHYALPSPSDCAHRIIPEIDEHFDMSQNIYCVIANLHRETCGVSDGGSSHNGWGLAVLSSCNLVSDISSILTHELLHAFGLPHDYRTAGIMSYGWSPTFLSFSKCAAEWLDVHRSFNSTPTQIDTTPSRIKVLPPLAHPPNAIRLRFEITDADGLHQAQFNGIPKPGISDFGPSLIACKSLSGKSATVEFITSDLKLPPDDYEILSVIDKHGNFTTEYFSIREFVNEGLQKEVNIEGDSVPNTDARIPVTLRKVAGDNQRGVPNSWLPQPLVVEVLDANGDPVVDAEVLFRALSYPEDSFPEGEIRTDYGILSDTNPRTDANGWAWSFLRLGYQNYHNPVVHASVVGVSESVHFNNLTSREKMVINRSEYPDMYWIDTLEGQGTLYGPDGSKWLLGSRVKSAVFNGVNRQLYWVTVEYQEGRYCGGIYCSAPDSSLFEPIEIVKLRSPPLGIAINPLTAKLYWTNVQGNIQTCHLDGSNVQTFLTGLNSPKHIAVDTVGSKLYWTDGHEHILHADLNGKNIQTFLKSQGTLGSITVAGDHLYWAEKVGAAEGQIRRVNLQTSKIQRLITFGNSRPIGIAVDGAGEKLYWTDTQGRIRRANFDGTDIEDVITGLIAPGHLIFGIPMAEVPAAPEIFRPQATQLLANYPNPFNPETWIPYQLANPTDVSLSIHAADGKLVRTLALGYQSAGVYQSKSRAAYWDGRNEVNEQVASGLYFYTITTGDFTATRKMLILK